MTALSLSAAIRKAKRRIEYYGVTEHKDKVAVVRSKLKKYGFTISSERAEELLKETS